MESVLLSPGRLLTPEHSKQELEDLKSVNDEFQATVLRMLAGKASACTGPGSIHENNLVGVEKLEKSASDSFIGSNALSMIYQSDNNTTDLLSLKYVAENHEDYLVCAKSDGVRYLLFVGNNGRAYFNDRKNQFFEVPLFVPPFCAKSKGGFACDYIFDGELVLNLREAQLLEKNPKARVRLQFLIFDCIKYNGENLAFKLYDYRLKMAKSFVNACLIYQDIFLDAKKQLFDRKDFKLCKRIDFFLKDFYLSKNVDFLMNAIIYADQPLLPHENDGLIFTKCNYPYLPGRNKGILKWKPNELNTVDFFITDNPYYPEKYKEIFADDDIFLFELYTVYGDHFHFFDFLLVTSVEEYSKIMGSFRHINGKPELEGNIVECNYDHEQEHPKLKWLYHVVYNGDSASCDRMIRNSKLRREWVQRNKPAMSQVEDEIAEGGPRRGRRRQRG